MPNAFTTQDESRLYVIGDNGWYICLTQTPTPTPTPNPTPNPNPYPSPNPNPNQVHLHHLRDLRRTRMPQRFRTLD